MRKHLFWLILCLSLSLTPALAQQPTEQEVTISVFKVDSAEYPTLKIYLSAFERNSLTPLATLAANDFTAQAAGQPVTITGLQPSPRPLDVVVLLDVTGSVAPQELANQTLAVQNLAARLAPDDQLALLTMGDQNVQVVASLNSDKSALLATLSTLSVQATTPNNVFWDGVYSALEMLQNARSDAKKVLVVITDLSAGSAGGSKTQQENLTLAVDAGLQVYGLYFDHEGDGLPSSQPLPPSELTTLADATGGIAWGVMGQALSTDNYTDDNALPTMLQSVSALMQNEIELTLTSPLRADGGEKELDITFTYQGTDIPVTTRFVAGQAFINITFPELSDGQAISLPYTLRVSATGLQGNLETLTAYALSEAGQRTTLGAIDLTALTLPLPAGSLPPGAFRLVVEASDNQGNRAEQDIFLTVVESLTVTLLDVPDETSVDEPLTVRAKLSLAATVQSVQLWVDGQEIARQDLGPFDEVQFTWQPSQTGTFELTVIAQDILGNSARQSARLQVTGGSSSNNLPFMLGAILLGAVILGGGWWWLRRLKNAPPEAPIPLVRASVPPPDLAEEDDLEPPTSLSPNTAPSSAAIAELSTAQGERWLLVAGDNTLGRHSSNLHQIKDDAVSRHHAVISVVGKRFYFRDAETASHPSEINGKLLTPGQQYELHNGDKIRLGSTIVTFTKL